MITSTALQSVFDIDHSLTEYYPVWGGTDEDRIRSYYDGNSNRSRALISRAAD